MKAETDMAIQIRAGERVLKSQKKGYEYNRMQTALQIATRYRPTRSARRAKIRMLTASETLKSTFPTRATPLDTPSCFVRYERLKVVTT